MLKNRLEVLSAELQTFSLDAHEEAGSVDQWSKVQDELGINELPGCNKPRKPDFNKSR